MNKVALVTGSSRGIGLAITKMLLGLDYKVYGVSRSKTNINNPSFINLNFDITNSDSIINLADMVSESKIDLLVNNAGMVLLQDSMEFTHDIFKKIFDLNFIAPIQITQTFLSKLSGSTIINISSVSDRIPENSAAMYCASKAALNIYFDSISTKYKDIRILHILPSYVDTPSLRRLVEEEEGWEVEWDKIVKPDHIGKLIMLLLSKNEIPNNSRIIALTNYLLEDKDIKESLYFFNGDDNRIEKVG